VVFSVLVKSADLAPVDVSLFIWLLPEHVRVNPAYSRSLCIYPAPAVLEKMTGSFRISARTDRVAGSIVCPMLVTEIKDRDRFQRLLLIRPDSQSVFFKEEDIAVEFPCAATATAVTTKPDR
jgi:hypothetical protein